MQPGSDLAAFPTRVQSKFVDLININREFV